MKINIAIAGGPCTGKSTLTAALFAKLKTLGFDYDVIVEQGRTLKKEFGHCHSTFDRFYLWRQQEREELRSTARNGFVTDAPLFQLYSQAVYYSKEPRDMLAVRELLRMCLDIADRYQLIVIAANPNEIPFEKDGWRKGSKKAARKKHQIVTSFCNHFFYERVLFVKGSVSKRIGMVVKKLRELRGESESMKRRP